MVSKCCPACCGIGSHLSLELVRDDSGVSIYRKVSVRRTCEVCHGTGRVQEEMVRLHTHFCNTQAMPRRKMPVGDAPPKPFERALGYFLLVAFFGYAWIMFFKGHDGVDLWPRIAIALAASFTLVAVLRRFSGTPRFLRWCTLALFLMMICGGVAFEIVRS